MTEKNNECAENVEIVSVEEKNPFLDFVRGIAETVTPIVMKSMEPNESQPTAAGGPESGICCIHCGKSVEGRYSELNVPNNSWRRNFDRYFLCESCTHDILNKE